MSTDLTIEYLIRDAHDSFRPHVTPGPWKLKHGEDHGHCCSWTSDGSAQVNGFGLLKCRDLHCTNVMLYQVPEKKPVRIDYEGTRVEDWKNFYRSQV